MRLPFQTIGQAEQRAIEPKLAAFVQFDHSAHQSAR